MLSQALRYNAGLIRANGIPFIHGNGAVNSGPLLDRQGNPISSGKLKRLDSIHRSDWQGRQLLYPTARTNYTEWSDDGTTWSASAPAGASITKTPNYAPSPRGDMSAVRLVCDVSSAPAGAESICTMPAEPPVVVAGNTYLGGIWVKATTPDQAGKKVWARHVGRSAGQIITLTSGWVLWPWPEVSYNDTPSFQIGVYGSSAWSPTVDFLAWGWFITDGPGAHITTGAAPVTVTDYTLAGTNVSFGETPVAGAICDWTGVAIR